MARSKPRLPRYAPPSLGGLLLLASWASALTSTPVSIGTPPTLAGVSAIPFVYYFVLSLNRRDRRCMAVNKRDTRSEFCRNRPENNRMIRCKTYPEHALWRWQQRWAEERPGEPIPTFWAELRRRLRLPNDPDLPETELEVAPEAGWALSSPEWVSVTGTLASLASVPTTTLVAVLV